MSPESLADRKYSSKSDVWSFGIMCWEIYSYGGKPYPYMSVHAVLSAIARGYRMPRPNAAPADA